MIHRIFVYGTLLSGFGNHKWILEGESTFVGPALSEARYTMLHLGGFPGIVEQGNDTIHGEVYEVDDRKLAELDSLEGTPDFYERRPISVIVDGQGWQDVQAYFLPDYWLDPLETGGKLAVIQSGNWRNRG